MTANVNTRELEAKVKDMYREVATPETVVCNADLWAACIGGAAQRDHCRNEIESAGLNVVRVRANSEYRFISDRALGATKKYGVKSVSILAVKP